jgi:hypothetical protein
MEKIVMNKEGDRAKCKDGEILWYGKEIEEWQEGKEEQ